MNHPFQKKVKMEEERQFAPPRSTSHYPHRKDPVFDTPEDTQEFLRSCDIVKVRKPPPNQPSKNECTCMKCEVIVWREMNLGIYEHLCCRQLKAWKARCPLDDTVTCVTQSEAYVAVTNKHAVQNLLVMLSQTGPHEDEGVALQDPPSNRNMRFGSYKVEWTIYVMSTPSFYYSNFQGRF